MPEVVRPAAGTDAVPYTTPYLELMQAAIAKFGITAEVQGKKECLVYWFLAQQIEGEPVSNKLADAMAKIIATPAARDFARKSGLEVLPLGPDAMRKYHIADLERLRKVANSAGIKPE